MSSFLYVDASEQSAGEVIEPVTVVIERHIEVHGGTVAHAEQAGKPPWGDDTEIGGAKVVAADHVKPA